MPYNQYDFVDAHGNVVYKVIAYSTTTLVPNSMVALWVAEIPDQPVAVVRIDGGLTMKQPTASSAPQPPSPSDTDSRLWRILSMSTGKGIEFAQVRATAIDATSHYGSTNLYRKNKSLVALIPQPSDVSIFLDAYLLFP